MADKAKEMTQDEKEALEIEAAHAEGLVKMIKDGVVAFVHHTCEEAHKVVGWVRAHV